MLFYNCVTDFLFACFSAYKCKLILDRKAFEVHSTLKSKYVKKKGFLELKDLK